MTSIIAIYRRFPTKESCIEHLETVRWKGKPHCPHCKTEGVVPPKVQIIKTYNAKDFLNDR